MLTRSLNTRDGAPLAENLHALDWLNYFLAAMLTGFGPFLAEGLTDGGGRPAEIGLALTARGLAGALVQAAVGEPIDRVKSKRAFVGTSITALMLAALIFGLRTDFLSVLV